MALTVTVPPASALLTTLSAVKGEFGIAPADRDQDDVLARMIARASDAIAVECNRIFGAASYVETLKGTDAQILGLAQAPLLAVTEVLEDDVAIADWDIEDAKAGALHRDAGWGRTIGLLAWGTEAYASRYILPGGTMLRRYRVTYRAGHTMPVQIAAHGQPGPADPPALPGAVEQACLETVKVWWFARDRDPDLRTIAVQSQGHMSYNVAGEQTGALPPVALALLRDYRRVL